MQDALTYTGISVLGGAFTTFIAGLFLYPCKISLFTKMAALLTGVIAFSLLWSLFFLMALCMILGPKD